jgi:hypothetical protein
VFIIEKNAKSTKPTVSKIDSLEQLLAQNKAVAFQDLWGYPTRLDDKLVGMISTHLLPPEFNTHNHCLQTKTRHYMKIMFREEQKFTQWWLWVILIGVGIFPVFGIYKQLILGEKFGDKPMSDPGPSFFVYLYLV